MTSPDRPPSVRPVEYKGEPLDAERGPGLGCFWFQVALLGILVVLTPLTVAWGWDPAISIALLFATLILLLLAGQTVIFLLRLVAADRREGTRHAPRASTTPTVGQLEDAAHVDDLGRPRDPGGAVPAAGSGAPGAATSAVAGDDVPGDAAPDDHAASDGDATTPGGARPEPGAGGASGEDQPAGPGMRE